MLYVTRTDHWQKSGGGGNQLRPSIPASGSVASASSLDVETASEAWSMDAVLASDSESLRLGDLDNEDAASVARSDDTRLTDDTTRSDPDGPLLDSSRYILV